MIDTDKYEGHTEGPWSGKAKNPRIHSIMASGDGKMVGICYGTVKVEREDPNEDPYESIRAVGSGLTRGEWADWARADALLIADAPLLLEEVKRLRDVINKAMQQHTVLHMRQQLFESCCIDAEGQYESGHWERDEE